MSRIRILSETLSNRIAAGEVVERPASVVKELVENALDADSTKILIEIRGGGRTLIRVSDNGTGMGRDDALLCLERYATSKLYDDTDLFQIKSLGFRGEALPSIASVSRFQLVTREQSATGGTEIIVDGGTIRQVSEIGAPPGTLVSVKQLFYNTPARRKFLKTVNTEMSHIADTISSIALSRPGVQFRLIHNDRTVKDWTKVADPATRVTDVLGDDLAAVLRPLGVTSDTVSITGWVADPHVTRSTARGIYVFVNGRYVHDRMIRHGLLEGYRDRLMKGRYPVAVLSLTVPFDQVDVNVHPMKHEVRFSEHRTVHDTLVRAVSETLQRGDRAARVPVSPAGRPADRGVGESVARYVPGNDSPPGPAVFPQGASGAADRSRITSPEPLRQAEQEGIWEKRFFADLQIIGQLHHTYILCQAEDGLVLIDQHAAHERVLLEQLQHRMSETQTSRQTLLMPETIDLGYREADVLQELMPALQDLGLEIEPFGGNTFVIKAVPSFLSGREMKPLLMEMLEEVVSVEAGGGEEKLGKARDQCLIVLACHGAIRANQVLNDRQMTALLGQLDQCRNPSHCPHGRPTWIRWTTGFLERSFRRVT